MTDDAPDSADSPKPVLTANAEAAKACERCGSWEAQEMAGQWLCTECIAVAGCGCAGSTIDEDG